MKNPLRLAVGIALAAGTLLILAGPVSGHEATGTTITCSQVSGTFQGFQASDHPIVWHVRVGAGSFQTVATVESPSNFVGSGSATAGISALTDQQHGTSATVQTFATWSTGQSATTSQMLTCGTPAVSPATAQPQVSASEVTAPTNGGVSPLAAAPAAPVPGAAPRFTG